MSTELIEFKGPMGFKGPTRGLMDFRGAMEMTLTNELVENRRPLSKFGESCGIFLFFFGVHKARDAQYLC